MRVSHTLATRTFVIGGLILFGVGLFFITNRHQLFTHTFEVYTEFDSLNSLRKGAIVNVSGMAGGEVLATQVPTRPDGRFRLKLRINQDLHALVRTDSVATIKTQGLGGSSYLDIQKGTPRAPELAAGGTVPSKEPFDMADLMQQGGNLLKTTQTSIEDIRASADQTLQSANAAAHHTDQTIVAMRPDLQATVASARKTTEDIREIVARVGQGEGTVGKLLEDQQLADSVGQTVENARQSSINLNNASARVNETMSDFQRRDLLGRAQAVLDSTRQVTEQLNQAIASFTSSPPGDQNAASGLRDTIASARTTMTNLAADTEAIKHNFFLRGFFKRRGYYNLKHMNQTQYRASKFVKGNSSERVWLSGASYSPPGPTARRC